MSFKIELKIPGETNWPTNGLRFATEDEARRYGEDLLNRWVIPETFRVAASDDPVTHEINEVGEMRILVERSQFKLESSNA